MSNAEHISPLGRGLLDRRAFMQTSGFALGGLGLAGLLAEEDPTGFSGKQPIRPTVDPNNPYAPRPGHFAMPAKQVLVIYCPGAVSHVDTFDHKPQLYREHGKEIAKGDHPEIQNRPGYERIFLKTPQWQFKQYGQCGKEVSSLFPEVARCVDEIAFINSMHTSLEG